MRILKRSPRRGDVVGKFLAKVREVPGEEIGRESWGAEAVGSLVVEAVREVLDES